MSRFFVSVGLLAAAFAVAGTLGSAQGGRPVPGSCEGISGHYGEGKGVVLGPDRTTLHVTMPNGRPNARGVCRNGNLTVNFPDDRSITGRFVGGTIRWNNGTNWTRIEGAGDIRPQQRSGSAGLCNGLSGIYNDGIVLVVGGAKLDVNVSMGGGRPEAYGSCTRQELTVTFPDHGTFTGVFDGGQIRWSNGTVWTRR